MSGIGGKWPVWTKELDNRLLEEVGAGRSLIAITVSMQMSTATINKRLKVMGFTGLRDARRVLLG